MHLYHYTCDHGRTQLGNAGVLLPAVAQRPDHGDRINLFPWQGWLVWMTDLDRPIREALGLTSVHLRCDRTAHRYRVTSLEHVMPWGRYAHDHKVPREVRDEIEQAPGRPAHWWVSLEPVPAVYDPVARKGYP